MLIVEAGHRPWHAAPTTFANRQRVGRPPEAVAGRPVPTLLQDAVPQRDALAQGDLNASQ